MTFIVGLTGGIGSGKTVVADLFAAQGVSIVDTDAIAHELTAAQGAAMTAIAAEFGRAVIAPEGQLNRAAMRHLVFSDSSVKHRLEAILHPMIRRESELRCLAAPSPYVILVVPLLIESGVYRQRINQLLVVDCDEETQISRVVERSALTPTEVRAIMQSQASRAERLALADAVLVNNGPLESLLPQVLNLHQSYIELAHAGSRNSC